jgi:hypothetical protein
MKDISKFGGHRTCRECRSGISRSSATITTQINPTSFSEFFDRESSQRSHLTVMQRSAIIILHSLGLDEDTIVSLTTCDPRTIRHWTAWYQLHRTVEDESRSGRPRATTEEVDTSIVAAATETPFTTPRIIRSGLGLDIATRTIRRRLDEVGLFGRVARIEYPFTEEHITRRLQFAQEHESWTDDKWKRVLFGDETYICLGAHGQVWVQRPEDTAYLSQYVAQGHVSFAPKIGIWGCFTSQGVNALRIFEDNMDTRLYTDTMQQYMKPCALRLWPNSEWFYLHDNASYHGSYRSCQWFHNKGINLIELPPFSPDLNPIENLWNHLKQRIEKRRAQNMSELTEIISDEWEKTDQLFCSNLVDSMRDRMRAVVNAEGFKTRY